MPEMLGSLPPGDRASAADALMHFLASGQKDLFKRTMPDRAAVARGEALYHHVGCVACHAPRDGSAPTANSVALPNMAEKWSVGGLRRFLLDPLAIRPSGRMPAMRLTDQEAGDIAHYLLRDVKVAAPVELAFYRGQFRSLDDIDSAELVHTEPVDAIAIDPATRDRGRALQFTAWLQIDEPAEYTFYFSAIGSSRFSIDGAWRAGENSWQHERVDEKFKTHLGKGLHSLRVDYIHRGNKPASLKLEWEHSGGTREPIPAARLRSAQVVPDEPPSFILDPNKASVGRGLYEKLKCGVCHDPASKGERAMALSALNAGRGCLADSPPNHSPNYHLDAGQRLSLASAIAQLNAPRLAVPSPAQHVAQTMHAMRCIACHRRNGEGGVTADRDRFFTSSGQDLGDEGRLAPHLDSVGNKLRPEWMEKVLFEGGSVRPYLDTRMPQFGRENLGHLVEWFVAVDRKPQPPPAVSDAPEAQKAAGRQIVGTQGGLSCITCHRFNHQPAQTMQIIDLTTAPERLYADWFSQFLLDPNRFHPGTRMPAFWPEGKSSLPALLGGSADRQFAALWTYLSDGPRARFPEGLSRENLELVVGGDPVLYRGKLWEAGFRGVAIGYPGQLNVAFDAEEMRLSLLWRGRFLNAGPHWTIQGMGQIRPLGTDVVVFPHGSPFAVLADANAAWPSGSSKSLGMKFKGYQFDLLKRPTLLYQFNAMGIEDFLSPVENRKISGVRRKMTFTSSPPEGLYARLAVGRLTQLSATSWKLNDAMTITIIGAGSPAARGAGDQQELIVHINSHDDKHALEVEYAW